MKFIMRDMLDIHYIDISYKKSIISFYEGDYIETFTIVSIVDVNIFIQMIPHMGELSLSKICIHSLTHILQIIWDV